MSLRTFSVLALLDWRQEFRQTMEQLGFVEDPEAGAWRNADGLTPAQWAHGLGPGEEARYYIETWGCQMNEHDSEIMAGQLEAMGYRPAASLEEADLIILNTCAVRETAEEKVYGTLGWLRQLKRRRPEVVLAFTGCMAQEEVTIQRLQRAAPHVDLVFGTHNIHRLPALIARVRQEEGMVVDVWKGAAGLVEHLPAKRADRTRAWVTIQYGCDKFCTYCIVPYTRGRERSRRPEDILREVEELAAQGYKEITLLGQTVSSYGQDFRDRRYTFADLLRDLNRVDGIRWIRFMSPYPGDFDERLIAALAECSKVCDHVHLPVQAGSDRVLHRMNRRYTRQQYLEIVRRLREAIPTVSITTDIIVGFPGETEEDFQQTLSLVEEVGFDNAFTFAFSPRAGTVGAKWEERFGVPDEVKQERLRRLMEVQYPIGLRRNQAYVGREAIVLVEGPSKKNPAVLSARTSTNKVVLFPGPAAWAGRFARVRITRASTFTLEAEVQEVMEDCPLPARLDAAERLPRRAIPA